MDAVARNRLYWKCRRGLLELDIVLQRFIPTLKDEDVQPLVALLDRVATVQQHAGVAVDVGDGRIAARGGEVSGVVGEHARLAVQRADIDHVRPDAAGEHRELELAPVVQGKRRFLVHGVLP